MSFYKFRILLSASASESSAQTNNTQNSGQGGAGTTITGGGTSAAGGGIVLSADNSKAPIVFNDPTAAIAALNNMTAVVQSALQGAGAEAAGSLGAIQTLQQQQVDAQAAQSTQNSDLLSQILSADSQLATTAQTGVDPATATTEKIAIFGGIAVALFAVFALLKGKRA